MKDDMTNFADDVRSGATCSLCRISPPGPGLAQPIGVPLDCRALICPACFAPLRPGAHRGRLGISEAIKQSKFDLTNSFNRMDMMLLLRRHMRVADWWCLLGEHWSSCDRISSHKERLRRYLSTARRPHLDAMMTDDELGAMESMPDAITVYRGCYAANIDGLSWTTSKDVAERFPTLNRYRRPGQRPLLIEGAAMARRAVLKLGRQEHEVISPSVRIVSVQIGEVLR